MRTLLLFLLVTTLAACDTVEDAPLTADPALLVGQWTFASERACGDGSGGCVDIDTRDEQVTFSAESIYTLVRDGETIQEGPYETTDSSVYLIRDQGRSWLGGFQVNQSTLVLSTAPADGPTTTYRRTE